MKVLVADDSITGLAILTASLTALGHEVVGVSSGEQAVELFIKVRPDFVILDVVMPNMSGFECARKLREMYNEYWIPIVFLSATVDDDSITQGIDAGGDDYLTKPFSQIMLAAKIKAMQRISDVQKKLYETTCKLSVLSSTDVLTGLDNRFQFNKTIKIQTSYANRYDTKFALILLDLDHFKEINDHLGHPAGDLLLQEVSKRLKSCIRDNDCLARLGGDEFAIILNRIKHVRESDLVAQRILDALEPAYYLANHNIHVTCSIGIACYPTSAKTPDALIRRADIAMYYAKESGRNNFQNYTEVFQAKHNQQFFLENSLRFASEKNELFMCYQPIFNLRTRRLVGMEALMRWNHQQFGLIAPDIFIPIAENTGLIKNIGKWSLQTVCEQAAIWFNAGYTNFSLAVNISPQQLLQPDLMDTIVKTLDTTHFPSRFLQFELTESTAMSLSDAIESTLKEMSAMKIRISLDDFGTGFSSLSHLKKLPIAALKIDKSFVMDLTKDASNALIVKSIIALGKTFKLNVIAEGIETEEQLQFLIKHKCNEGQGFYLSKPLTAEEMTIFLRDHFSGPVKKTIGRNP